MVKRLEFEQPHVGRKGVTKHRTSSLLLQLTVSNSQACFVGPYGFFEFSVNIVSPAVFALVGIRSPPTVCEPCNLPYFLQLCIFSFFPLNSPIK